MYPEVFFERAMTNELKSRQDARSLVKLRGVNRRFGRLKSESSRLRSVITSLSMLTRCLRSLSFAFQVRPLARLDEARPVERMPASFAFDHLQLHMPQPIASPLSALQRLVVLSHQVPRAEIRNRPQTHHLRLRSRQRQRPPQSEDPFAILHLAHSSVAGREHDQLRPKQIKPRGF